MTGAQIESHGSFVRFFFRMPSKLPSTLRWQARHTAGHDAFSWCFASRSVPQVGCNFVAELPGQVLSHVAAICGVGISPNSQRVAAKGAFLMLVLLPMESKFK